MKIQNGLAVETSLDALGEERTDVVYTKETALQYLEAAKEAQALYEQQLKVIDEDVASAQQVCEKLGYL